MAEKGAQHPLDSPLWPIGQRPFTSSGLPSLFLSHTSILCVFPYCYSIYRLFWPPLELPVLPPPSLPVFTSILRARKQDAHTCWNKKKCTGTRSNPRFPLRKATSLCYLPAALLPMGSKHEAVRLSDYRICAQLQRQHCLSFCSDFAKGLSATRRWLILSPQRL